MWNERTFPLDPSWTNRWNGRGEEKEKQRERESFREGSSIFSLNFPTIGLVVSSGARGKVYPHGKSFASRLESRSFDKLLEVRVFLLLGLVFG